MGTQPQSLPSSIVVTGGTGFCVGANETYNKVSDTMYNGNNGQIVYTVDRWIINMYQIPSFDLVSSWPLGNYTGRSDGPCSGQTAKGK